MTREAAYWIEFQPAITLGKARALDEREAIEVFTPIQIPVHWKEKAKIIRGGEVVKTVWRERQGLAIYKPGEVLHREWRAASKWEIEQWKNLPEEELQKLGVFRKNGDLSVLIVEKIKDLPSAVRQRIRHIPAGLTSRKREKFVLAGDAQLMGDFALKLNNLVNKLLTIRKPQDLLEKASAELSNTHRLLERSRTFLKRMALEDIKLALQGKFWEVTAQTTQVSANLLGQRARDYEMAYQSIKLGENWLNLMVEIEGKFRDCYNRLGQLGEKLQKLLSISEAIKPESLLLIANEASGIRRYLAEKVPQFNPYCQRLQAPEFQRLSRVADHAKDGKANTVLNDINLALAKLEVMAIGERPTKAELSKEKERFF